MKHEPACNGRYTRRDWIIAAVLVLIVFLLGLSQLTRGIPDWGDDFAAYITEGIAIANGELAEQAERNYLYHPTQLPAEADPSGLVYVWGFPLLLALVYRIVGFDAQNYSSVIYYKIPSLICLALTAGVLYLFLKRRCSRKLSVLMTLLFILLNDFLSFLNRIYSDICFMFFSTLVLFLLDLFLYPPLPLEGTSLNVSDKSNRPSILMGIALGAALWYACEVRLNGIALLAVMLLAHLVYLLKNRGIGSRAQIVRHILPYCVFVVLRLVSEHLLFLPPTSNISDLSRATLALMQSHVTKYYYMTISFLMSLAHMPWRARFLLCLICAVGFFFRGFRQQNLHLVPLFVGTYIIAIMLPYTQGIRYLYHILPILVFYFASGIQQIHDWIDSAFGALLFLRRLYRGILYALGAIVLFFTFTDAIHSGYQNILANRQPAKIDVYSEDAIEIYRYIQENVPEQAVIACSKPRALYLNTGRMGFSLFANGHEMTDAAYYLKIHETDDTVEQNQHLLQEEFTSGIFTLYRVLDA